MIIEESFAVAAPRDAVAAFLVDVERMSRCVPGVEKVETTGNGEYRATLHARLGPMTAAFQGSLRVDDSEAPRRLVASGSGQDRRTASRAKVEFSAELDETGTETMVRSRADVVIQGRLGQFGTGVIHSTARELVREFAECVNATLSGHAGTQQTDGQGPPAPSLSRVGSRGIRIWLASLASSAWSAVRRVTRSAGRD